MRPQRPRHQEMQNIIREAKRALRIQVSAGLKRMGPGERAAASARARALLAAQPLWKTAQWVLFFAPLPEELDVWPLLTEALAAGKKIGLPRFVAEDSTYEACQIQDPKSDLRVGHFGIREPASRCAPLPSTRLDLILVPGVAFDLRGRRLGRARDTTTSCWWNCAEQRAEWHSMSRSWRKSPSHPTMCTWTASLPRRAGSI